MRFFASIIYDLTSNATMILNCHLPDQNLDWPVATLVPFLAVHVFWNRTLRNNRNSYF